MDKLRQLFARSFGVDTTGTLITTILTYLIIGGVLGLIIKIVGHLPFVGFVAWILGCAVELYVLAGVVLAVLHYFKIV